MIKNLGKFKQWTGERLGAAKATLQTEDFQRLEIETERRRAGFDRVVEAIDVSHAQLSKKKPSPEDAKIKISPMESLGACWSHYGDSFDTDSSAGASFVNYGQATTLVAHLQEEFALSMKEVYIATLQRGQIEYKEYLSLRKKLESRRLDYDAKLGRLQKSKKEKPEWEQEMQASKMKYEETEYDLIQKMVALQEFEEEHSEALGMLLDAQIEFFNSAVERLSSVRSNWPQSTRDGPRVPMTRTGSSSSGLTRSPNGTEDYFTPAPDRTGLTPRSPNGSPCIRGPTSRQLSADPITPRRVPSHTSLRGGDDPVTTIPSSPGRLAPQMPRRQSQSTVGSKKKRKAIYDFEGDSVDELSFRTGDIITVVEEVDEGWWLGEVENIGPKRRGIFPVNYTEEIIGAPPMPARPLTTASPQIPEAEIEAEEEYSQVPHEASPFHDKPASNYSFTRPAQPLRAYSTNTYTSPSPPPLARSTTFVPQATKPTGASRAPPPPPPPSAARASPATSRSYTTNTQPAARVPPPPPQSRTQEPVGEPSCQECGCVDFSANLFKRGHCNNCFHKH
ncbi:hypothetical protein CLU79DRAFT_727703 [Phycomyces nitens]|nr:hypothetical protein CLU79DRAFT_727703 [Phycomyces nitens]